MPRGLIPEALVQQSELVVWTNELASKYDSCAICHEYFNAAIPDICRLLECSHVFHAKCVDLWFIKATFCPLCKSDLKATFRHNSSQRSLGRSSHTSSQMSLGDRSHASTIRSGQILVGHSNSDPALLRILQESPYSMSITHRISPPQTPDRQQGSTASLAISFSDRSLVGSSRSERSLGILSSNSSGPLPAVQELSDEARLAEVDSQQSQSNPPSPQQPHLGDDQDERQSSDDAAEPWRPLIAEEEADNDETLCSDATLSQLPQVLQPTASKTALLLHTLVEPSEGKGETLEASNVGSGAMTSGGTVATETWKSSSSSSQELPRSAAINSVLRNNSWINSRSNVGLRSGDRGRSVALPKVVAASDGNPTQNTSPASSAVSTFSGYRRRASPTPVTKRGYIQAPTQNDKMVHQEGELSSSFRAIGFGTPPRSSFDVQPSPLTAASSTANVSIISGLATPPSIGVATMSMSLSGQPRPSPYMTFASGLHMVPASQSGPTTTPQSNRTPGHPAISLQQNNALHQRF